MTDWLNDWLEFADIDEHLQLKINKETEVKEKNIISVEVFWDKDTSTVNEVQLDMNLKSNTIECTFKPHLAPKEDMIIGDLFFRAPAMIFEQSNKMLALIPDIDYLEEKRQTPHFMDYVKEGSKLFYGIGYYKKTRHVYHKRVNKPFTVQNKQTLFKFYLVEWKNIGDRRNFTLVNQFLWEKFGKKRMIIEEVRNTESALNDLVKYAEYTYNWAFNTWKPIVWQQFKLNGRDVGAPVLIVRTAQKPGLGHEDSWREKKSIWNQAWFSSLRSAYGYRLWGMKWNNSDLIEKSELAKQFALSAPQTNGLFPALYEAGEDLKWENGKWGHSNRRPENHEDFGHLLDMSWTCYWMMKWYMNIEKDDDLLEYALIYAERLLELQQPNGNIPGWVHMTTGEISPYLIDSPETSMHALFLIFLYKVTKEEKYLIASKKAMNFVIDDVIPSGRWEDFETYWSCSTMWEGKAYGEVEKRSGLYNQCSFSIYWTTEALKELYKVTNNKEYLSKGEQTLAELSLYQAIWDPGYVNVPVLGGFAVMNTDDEWNDARQSLIATTYDDYYKLTKNEEYKYRSIWAMKASFYMMYCPENVTVKELYEKTFPYMNYEDYGFEMENAHHGENIDIAGEFTIFDWGNGSASSALAELLFNNQYLFSE